MKSTYQAPVLRAHGSVEKDTHQMITGSAADATFPAGTQVNQITLS